MDGSRHTVRVWVALACALLAGMTSISPAAASEGAGWSIACPFSHRASDDPIVYPRQPGASHSHDFFGNASTDAFSTVGSLRSHPTTCRLSADTAGYWVPTLMLHGTPTAPVDVTVYYHNDLVAPHKVRVFPAGLRIVAGDAHATSEPSTKVIYWTCDGPTPGGQYWTSPQDCGTHDVVANVRFPACWDGVHLDSADHKSHMAYNVQRPDDTWTCPASHHVSVPRLRIRLQYPASDGNGLAFSSGPYYTLHADFLNAWTQRKLHHFVRACIRRDVNCGRIHDRKGS